ncbi:cyclic nucleotide-binding domain-containing protein [Actinopolymorpha alba]|uniref:cyclic nucleotide-binding domain-containing protein n=1 Tax=Actinopolymorpha alba TaxID=533267 RepID=UPI00036B5C66|nr:cyclic nucleotide-binding domain-containing protein [Actinopolymorpha alba]
MSGSGPDDVTRASTDELAAHPFLAGMPKDHVARLAGHARKVTLTKGDQIFVEGGDADRFWLLWDGQVLLDLHVPGRGTLLVETLGPGDVLGWSWLLAPHEWRFGAVAALDTNAVEVVAAPIRTMAEENPEFGRTMYRRFSEVATARLQATRLRLLDVSAGTRSPA